MGEKDAERRTEKRPHDADRDPFADHAKHDAGAAHPKTAQNPDLPTLPDHGHGHGVVDQEGAHEERDEAEDEQVELKRTEHLLDLGVPCLGALDVDPDRQPSAQVCGYPLRVRARLE